MHVCVPVCMHGCMCLCEHCVHACVFQCIYYICGIYTIIINRFRLSIYHFEFLYSILVNDIVLVNSEYCRFSQHSIAIMVH